MVAITKNRILTFFIAAVWFVNGFFCKALNIVPRHEQIVARILGDDFSKPITVVIGLAEIVMAAWIISRIKTRLNALTQIFLIATMNILEFILAPELLLWGKLNSVFALMFIGLIWYHEFVLNNNKAEQ